MEDIRAALALQMIKDIGPATAKTLIDAIGSPSEVFGVDMDVLRAVDRLRATRAENIRSFDAWDDVDTILDECRKKSINLTYYGADDYPELLGQITDPPSIIYFRGSLVPQDKYAVSMVGSRRASSYGKSVARYISEQLSSMGFTIVSGMARGIDSISHRGALRKDGRTIAVLGSGIDVIYPPENRDLYDRISRSGSVISEFPLTTAPHKENFPRRNRVISGLSLGVIVVEASKGSGTLITAMSALEQNRDVFAVPGNINSGNSYGTNELIKGGAKVLTRPDDVVEELGHQLKGFIKTEKREKIDITTEEKQICDILSGEPVHIDDITRRSGYPSSKILGLLLGLELKSVVGQVEGKKFFLMQEEHGV